MIRDSTVWVYKQKHVEDTKEEEEKMAPLANITEQKGSWQETNSD